MLYLFLSHKKEIDRALTKFVQETNEMLDHCALQEKETKLKLQRMTRMADFSYKLYMGICGCIATYILFLMF
jgi:hypothetical protein